jgi:outer membrane immunogenic protein
MKAFVRGAIAFVALTTAAPALASPRAAAPADDWSGIYAGVSIGARWSDTIWTTNCGNALPNCGGASLGVHNPVGFDSSTARVGGYLGYNWQVAPTWLLGVEADIAWGDSSKTVTGIPGTIAAAPALAATGDTATVKQKWDGSVRARVGFLANRAWLIYAAGGVAWQQVDLAASCTGVIAGSLCGAGLSASETFSTTKAGWTVGGGLEAAFWGNWLGRVEYRYADYGTINHTFFINNANVTSSLSMSQSLRTHTVLVGLTYKFGRP